MAAFPMPDITNSWGYHSGAPPTTASFPSSNPALPFNGFSYMGATPLNQPRRHFPNATPVLGNYAGNVAENDLTLDPYISKFSPTTQWQMAGKPYSSGLESFASPDNDNHKQLYDSGANMRQVVDLPDPQMQVQLCDKELWNQFSNAGTEMIVTKTGRRMFPGYRIKISGLDLDAKYCVMMDIVNVDDHRYKFQHGEWTIAGRGEPHLPQRFFLHPDSPATGAKWMSEMVSFHKVKLTNSIGRDVDGKIVLNSMHRYQPRIHIVRTNDTSRVHMQRLCTFAFPQTVFVTVTAYQNPEVTKLKIDNNPFAKGFREDGARAKKPRTQQSNYEEYDQGTYSNAKRHAFDSGFQQQGRMQTQLTPIAISHSSRLGYDTGASPVLSNSSSKSFPNAYPHPQYYDNFMPNSNTKYVPNLASSDVTEYWKPVQYDQQSNDSNVSYGNPRDMLQMNHNTSSIVDNNVSLSPPVMHQYSQNNSLPYYNTESTTNYTDLYKPTQNVENPQFPQNLEDIVEKSVQFNNHSSETTIRSSDSGIGSSPLALSDDDNSNLVSTTDTVAHPGQQNELLVSSSAATSFKNETDASNFENTENNEPTTHCLENVKNFDDHLQSEKPNAQQSDTAYLISDLSPDSQRLSYPNPQGIFNFPSENFYESNNADQTESDCAINWETGLVKM